MFDFCITFKWLDTALNVIVLLQQVIQARWYFDHPLFCLPNLSAHSIEGLAPLSTIPQFKDELGLYGISNIRNSKVVDATRKIMNNSILEKDEAKEVKNYKKILIFK